VENEKKSHKTKDDAASKQTAPKEKTMTVSLKRQNGKK